MLVSNARNTLEIYVQNTEKGAIDAGRSVIWMADMETVVGHLNDCLEVSKRYNTWIFVRKDIVVDTLALLKEQNHSKNSNSSDQPEIVRCKYCKYSKRYADGEDALYGCENGAGLHEPYWFCADGRKSR